MKLGILIALLLCGCAAHKQKNAFDSHASPVDRHKCRLISKPTDSMQVWQCPGYQVQELSGKRNQ